ncbi:hypothetical protein GQ457_11G001080 [Hibiscus cannabinus]
MSGDHSGSYSVKSGYRLLSQVGPVDATDKQLYKSMWSISCPSKMKIQVWKFIQNMCLIMYNLYNRRIVPDALCPMCNQYIETIEHVLLDYEFPKSVWQGFGYSWPSHVAAYSLQDWLLWIFSHIPSIKFVEIIITLWAIWFARNRKIYEGKSQTKDSLITWVKSYCLKLETLSPRLNPVSPQTLARWIPPTSHFVKANYDASFCSSSLHSYSGVVIRDSDGLVLGSCRRASTWVVTPFAAEATAALHALLFAIDLGFTSVILEGDSLSITRKLQSKECDISEISALIWDVQQLSKSLHACSFLHTPRSGNKVAHLLAKSDSLGPDDRFWVEEVPSVVRQAVAEDRRLLDPP